MKTHISNLFAILTAGILAACSTVTVTTDHDPSASFARYKTYTLAPAAHDQALSPTAEAAMRSALRTHLAARGISEVSGHKADLDVVRHVFLEDKVSVRQYTDMGYDRYGRWPYRYGYYGMWSGAPRTYTDVHQYTEGTLILDFVDAHTGKSVFRGTATAVVGGTEGNTRKIDEAVEKIVAELPGGPAH
ncbi:MAG TPA: DUF4136 domain-containing protein [Chthoniobacter sp.]|jgi:hypothetical protein